MHIIDDCLPKQFFEEFVEQVCDWQNVPFYYSQYTALRNAETECLYQASWAHGAISHGRDNSQLAPWCREAVRIILNGFNESLVELHRVRIGLITPAPQKIIHGAHIDMWNFPHRTGLLYLNDSDGDTIFYNKFHSKDDKEPLICTDEDVSQTITPKANRATVFDGWQYHSSTTPINTKHRLVMNFNYTSK